MKTLLFIILLASGCGPRTQETPTLTSTFCQEMILHGGYVGYVCPHKEHHIEVITIPHWTGNDITYICRCGERSKDAGR